MNNKPLELIINDSCNPKNYREIFNQRGTSYTNAMKLCPDARNEEFKTLINLLDLTDGDKLIDIPSGGGYLQSHLSQDIELYSVDEANQFLSTDILKNRLCTDTCHTPFNNNFFDKAYSLAGSHHMPDKNEFYNEVNRILKPGGIFAYADVAKDSSVDTFLNVFVNNHNSMGHMGDFLNLKTTRRDLESSNFTVVESYLCNYQWAFTTQLQASIFFKNLFGLDLATHKDVISGINKYLGSKTTENGYYVDWQLLHFKAIA